MNFKPIQNRILLQARAIEETTPGGLMIPEVARTRSQEFDVVAVGPKVVAVKTSDIAILGQYSGNNLTIEGKDYIIVREEEVLAVR